MTQNSGSSARARTQSASHHEASHFPDFMREIVAIFDTELRHTYVNPAVEDFTGRPATDFLGRTNREMGMPSELVDQWDRELRAAFTTGLPSEIQFAFDSTEGPRQFHSRLSPQANAHGVVTSVISAARVVDDDRAATLTAEHFRAIIDSSDDAIISKTLDGIVTSWNRGAELIFGYSSAEMVGNSLLVLFPLDRQNEERFILERLLLGEKVDHFETVRVRKDGSLVPVSVSISPICDQMGNIIGASKVARDISGRVQAELAIKSALKEKEALLNEVHHRVRNNLQIITSLLRLEVGRSVEPSFRDLLDDTRSRIRAMALVDESLDRNDGQTKLRLDRYIQNLAAAVFQNARRGTGNAKLTLQLTPVRLALNQATPCGLMINEIIHSRLKNGFPEGYHGDLKVALAFDPARDMCTLGISDSGVGFSSEFESGRNGPLGLQLVRELAQQMEGRLTIRKGEPSGAVFEIEFRPAAQD